MLNRETNCCNCNCNCNYNYNYNCNCNCQFTDLTIDPCARYKVRVQSLEMELDQKNQCLNEIQQENRRLINDKRDIEKENYINKAELGRIDI